MYAVGQLDSERMIVCMVRLKVCDSLYMFYAYVAHTTSMQLCTCVCVCVCVSVCVCVCVCLCWFLWVYLSADVHVCLSYRPNTTDVLFGRRGMFEIGTP